MGEVDTRRRWWKEAIYSPKIIATFLLYIAWFAVPGVMLFPLNAVGLMEWHRDLWEALPLLWLCLCVAVLFQVIYTSKIHRDCHHNVLMNVVASVAVGGVTVGLALVAFSISFVDLPTVMSTNGAQQAIQAPGPSPGSRLAKRRYVIALDVSDSFVTPAKVEEERLKMAGALAERLFLPTAQMASLVKPQDCTVVMVFAGTFSVGTDHCKEIGNPADLPGVIVRQLRSKVASRSDQPDKTDLVHFLQALIAELETQERQPTTILLMSDLRQDESNKGSPDGHRSGLRDLRSLLQTIPDLRFFVVVDDQTRARGHRLRREDLNLQEDRWQEVSWESFQTADPEDQLAALALGIYTEQPLKPMYLKYFFSQHQEGVPSSVNLPSIPSFENVVLGLIPEGGDEDASRRLKIKASFDDPRILSMESAAVSSVILPKTADSLSISIAGAQDVLRSVRCNLLIAVPGQSVMYMVPICVIPTFRAAACLLFKTLAFAMVFILAILGCSAAKAYVFHQSSPHPAEARPSLPEETV